MTYDNTNTGTLNRSKEKFTDRSPDWYGTIKIEGAILEAALAGKPIRLAGWMRDGQYGEFISLKASLPKEMTTERPAKAAGAPAQKGYDWDKANTQIPPTPAKNTTVEDFDDSDIPF